MAGDALRCLGEYARWFPQVVPGAAPKITITRHRKERPPPASFVTPRLKSELQPGGRGYRSQTCRMAGSPVIAVGLYERAGGAWIDTGLVFTIRNGTPIEPRNFTPSLVDCFIPGASLLPAATRGRAIMP